MNNNNNNNTMDTIMKQRCTQIPPQMYSYGAWSEFRNFSQGLPALEIQIIVIVILTQLIHYPLQRFRYPRILAEVFAGIILGPTMPLPIYEQTSKLFPFESQETITTLSAFGYAFLLFMIGVKSDVTLITKTGKKAVIIGFLSLIVPVTIGMATANFFVLDENPKSLDSLRLVVATQSLTPFSGIALLLKDLKLLNSELGRLALSSAAISEVMNVTLITTMNLYRVYLRTNSMNDVYLDLGLFVLFLLIVFLIIRPAMIWIVKQTPEGREVKDVYLYVAILVALLACTFTHYMDQYALLGAFVIGLAIPDGPPFGSALVDKFESYVSGLLVPVFVTVNASRADIWGIFNKSSLTYATVIPFIYGFKLAAVVVPAWFSMVPLRDALALGLIMCTKGVVDVASYSISRNQEIIDEKTMAILITTTVIIAVATTVTVRRLYNPERKYAGYQSRNIMHTKMDAELRIVACLHRPDNINGFINLIDASGPTRECPMTISLLHLIELHGRASPIFISHQLQKKSSSGESYSEDILLAFRQFELKKNGAVSTQCFTAISPRKFMHEDICTLALDKLASLIIVPFHRKWDFQGSIEEEDNALRTLNEKLIDKAPSSVGIFVDRGLIARESSLAVAMVFLGGHDDREALTYAKRLARDSSLSLTVIHCASTEEENNLNRRETVLDNEALKDVKGNNIGSEFVFFVEEKVNDGPDTARIIRGMIDEYDLIIVGRRHNLQSSQTSGLSEWIEFPELGVIGDFLATIEGKCRASVLVIQQQKLKIH